MIQKLLFALLIGLLAGCSSENHPEEHAEEQGEGIVHLAEESRELIGLKMTKVERVPLIASIDVVGEIAQETENVVHVTSPKPGILKSYLVELGEIVEKNTPLCVIETKSKETLEIHSPAHGLVLAKYLKEGNSLDPVTSILTIANMDLLRASFNVYEKDLTGIRSGQKLIVRSVAYPNETFEGTIGFISPRVDAMTRTIKLRVDIENEEHKLKFGMFVTGEIIVIQEETVLAVPQDAVTFLNDRPIVFVPKQDDEFIVRSVEVGQMFNGWTEIQSGLSEGEQVVTSGSFQLKSELLKETFEAGHAH